MMPDTRKKKREFTKLMQVINTNITLDSYLKSYSYP